MLNYTNILIEILLQGIVGVLVFTIIACIILNVHSKAKNFQKIINSKNDLCHIFSLICCIIVFFLGLIICFFFNKNTFNFQGCGGYYLVSIYNIGFFFGLDGISLIFLLLTVLIFPICIFAT